jgi:excinuclease ABC subunit C
MIPESVKILNGVLPDKSGVYLYKDEQGTVIYVGKATSLKRRVSSYWTGAKDAKTTELLRHIRSIDYQECGSVLEALVVEANLIRRWQPKYNILARDDKSFLYLAFTRTEYPRPVMLRGRDLANAPKSQYLATFGPFIQPAALRAALEILRRIFPYSNCEPRKGPIGSSGKVKPPKPCFDFHIGKCAGVCIGAADKSEYRENIKNLIKFFKGQSAGIIKDAKKKMAEAAKSEDYERAALYRNRIRDLTNVRDVSVLTRETAPQEFIDVFGRIEGYDISNVGGEHAVGSMVVFEDGVPKKSAYRIFHIKTVSGANDVASLREVLGRRVKHTEWPKPDIVLIDGGRGQLDAVRPVFAAAGWKMPVFGLAKGPDRKNDEVIPAERDDWELKRLVESQKRLFQQVRDEAHRFAISKYRARHRKFLIA